MKPSGYIRYVYSITDKGRKLLEDAKERKLLSKKLESIIAVVAEDFGKLELSELVKEAYRRFSK
jgi:DNA-binding PadR family transcriptional regulator